MTRRCPQCRETYEQPAERPKCAPFCSDRCKLVDLSKWIDEDYVVSERGPRLWGFDDPQN